MNRTIAGITATLTFTGLISGISNVRSSSTETNGIKGKLSTNTSAMGPWVWGMRKFPFPYISMLAMSPDADHETLRKFNLVHTFLNTTAHTAMGQGLGLDIADSFFMYNGSNLNSYTDVNNTPLSDQLTWFKGTSTIPYGASVLNTYIKSGWIDTMHTYGDFSMTNFNQTEFTPQLAEQAINVLKQDGDYLTVWTDHGNQSNVDAFGNYGTESFYSYQQGANPWSMYYHTDLLIPYGIKFVWADGFSDVFGSSSMIYPIDLPDGRQIWGFNRYTDTGQSAGGAVQYVWSADDIPVELSQSHLNEIIKNHDYSIVATHFSADNSELPFTKSTIRSLKLLQKEYLQGNILVTRTSRLLSYNVLQQYLKYKINRLPGKTIINIEGVADPVFGWSVPSIEDLHGITFYTANPKETVIELNGKLVPQKDLQDNKNDGTAPSIGFKWYPPNTTNYAINSTTVH